MRKIILLISVVFISASSMTVDWGFWAHKRINRLAIFTLPQSMFGFYKSNVEYITEHAVDPDKRRYATKHEAVRHYIDLDQWGEYPYLEVPRNFSEAVQKYLGWNYLSPSGDTIALSASIDSSNIENMIVKGKRISFSIPTFAFDKFYKSNIFNFQDYYEAPWTFTSTDFFDQLGIEPSVEAGSFHFVDNFSVHGILPFHMLDTQNKLRNAFVRKDGAAILRISSEFGHYIGDAHVPLHTTSNYNGQLTNQLGIHAFWESRIPELLADENWDYFVGKCEYIDSLPQYFWNIVLTSNSLVDSVLTIEKRLSQEFPEDAQFCQDLRNGYPVRTQCADYTRAFDAAMGGMVEERMRSSVLAIGSCWYTAWVDAGRPVLDSLWQNGKVEIAAEEIKPGISPARAHEN